ncbi:MAG: hypothetical protein IPM51_00775 [Sphingobacteriaceae bacterium]|nr:hypothetical protein [Sphingobacteriaceae bacterium]
MTSFTLLTCKKYDEGGLVARRCKNLFGGTKSGSSKTWKLKKYEVDGIDSTYLINTGGIPDFYEKHLTITLVDKKDMCSYNASSFIFKYSGTISASYKSIIIGNNIDLITLNSQCRIIDNINYCSRNIFYPDQSDPISEWKITKLTRNEVILHKQNKKNYHIKLQN